MTSEPNPSWNPKRHRGLKTRWLEANSKASNGAPPNQFPGEKPEKGRRIQGLPSRRSRRALPARTAVRRDGDRQKRSPSGSAPLLSVGWINVSAASARSQARSSRSAFRVVSSNVEGLPIVASLHRKIVRRDPRDRAPPDRPSTPAHRAPPSCRGAHDELPVRRHGVEGRSASSPRFAMLGVTRSCARGRRMIKSRHSLGSANVPEMAPTPRI